MKTFSFLAFFLLTASVMVHGQNYFRSGIFLHHSTGGCIWGPNGSNTSVPQQMELYNSLHGYIGPAAVAMNEEWWSPGDNEWATQHAFFEDPSPVTGIGYYLPDNKIVVIKTCFPASAMSGVGGPSDTLSPYLKTIYNYKWHWRHIVNVMRNHPENFFVIWTNAPLEPYSTNLSEAALSKRFCAWAKDTLAQGLDPDFGAFPANVYVFDFFHKLTGPSGMMLEMYAAGHGDSHPNAAATQLVAPQFVGEIFNSSIDYEVIYGMAPLNAMTDFSLRIFPNPSRGDFGLCFFSESAQKVTVTLFDQSGKMLKKLVDGYFSKGEHTLHASLNPMAQGIYYVRFVQGSNVETTHLLVKK